MKRIGTWLVRKSLGQKPADVLPVLLEGEQLALVQEAAPVVHEELDALLWACSQRRLVAVAVPRGTEANAVN